VVVGVGVAVDVGGVVDGGTVVVVVVTTGEDGPGDPG
jgi:hypothetical protein